MVVVVVVVEISALGLWSHELKEEFSRSARRFHTVLFLVNLLTECGM